MQTKEEKNKAPETPTLEEFEASMTEQLDDAQKAFRDRISREEKRMKDACDCNYYFTVYFQNSEQLFEFCDKFGISRDALYVDGRQLAKQCKRALETEDTVFPKTQPFNRDYVERARKKRP